jgi:hypothetical protein
MRLLSEVQRLSDEHWHIFLRPRQAMDEKAWVGPSGHDFDRRLERSGHSLQTQLSESVQLIREKLRRTH